MSPWKDFRVRDAGLRVRQHDRRPRQWRHLDTCGFVTMIEADVPRVDCPVHGVRQAKVPWAESGSGFTAMFEALGISWLNVATSKAVPERMKISWDEAWGVMERAVSRGLARREDTPIEETRGRRDVLPEAHEYVTVRVDRKTGTVLDILDDRKKATLKNWLKTNKERLKAVRSVSMDMWEPFILAVRETLEDADDKICFDHFHVAGHFGKALDKIRASEHRELGRSGKSPLTKTKHDWLRTKAKNEYRDKRAFLRLTRLNLKTARAWRIKEAAMACGLIPTEVSPKGTGRRSWAGLPNADSIQ